MSPEFPLRIITDDGECAVIASPEELMASVDSIDSTDPAQKIWVRDACDRIVDVRMRAGIIDILRLHF